MDCERSCSYFNNFIIISGFYKPFQQIIDMDIRSYIKYLCIFYGILIGILYFKTHYIGGGEVGDGKGSFKEFIVIRGE